MAETLYINNGSSWVATQLNPEDIAYPGFVTTTATTEA